MGSLNWVLGEQLNQVIVSIGLHGHREHRWRHNAITMHKQMDMHKYKFIASVFPLPQNDSDFTSPVRRVCKHNNSLTPRRWLEDKRNELADLQHQRSFKGLALLPHILMTTQSVRSEKQGMKVSPSCIWERTLAPDPYRIAFCFLLAPLQKSVSLRSSILPRQCSQGVLSFHTVTRETQTTVTESWGGVGWGQLQCVVSDYPIKL